MSNVVILLSSALFFLFLFGFVFAVVRKRKKKSVSSEGYTNEQVYVGNLAYSVTEDDLRNYFVRFGPIHSVRVIRNFKTGRSKGYAFVTYFTVENASAALVTHGKDFCGRSIVVRIAKPRHDGQDDNQDSNRDA